MLDLEVRGEPVQVRLHRRGHGVLVVGVHPAKPVFGPPGGVLLAGKGEQLQPSVRVVDRIGPKVPVPDPVAGSGNGELVALAAHAELFSDAAALHRVSDRAADELAVDAVLREVVRGTRAHRLQGRIAIDAGLHDEGQGADRSEAPDGLNPAGVFDAEIEQPEIVRPGLRALNGVRKVGHVIDGVLALRVLERI